MADLGVVRTIAEIGYIRDGYRLQATLAASTDTAASPGPLRAAARPRPRQRAPRMLMTPPAREDAIPTVIADQVQLGLPAGREVHLARIEIRTDRFPISSSTSPAIRRS